jgi:hypothetical protein
VKVLYTGRLVGVLVGNGVGVSVANNPVIDAGRALQAASKKEKTRAKKNPKTL